MKLKFTYCLLLMFFNTVLLLGQNPDEIISNNIKNSGGYDSWNNLNSIILKGEVTLNLNNSYPIIINHQRPYYKRVSFIIDGKEILNEGYDGKLGWTFSDVNKKNVIVPNYTPDAFDSDLLKYKQKGFKAEFISMDNTNNCFKIKLIKNDNESIYCFNKKDYQLIYEQNKDETIFYSDYKNFNGLTFATKLIGKPTEGGEYIIRFIEIQTNPKIDKKMFKF